MYRVEVINHQNPYDVWERMPTYPDFDNIDDAVECVRKNRIEDYFNDDDFEYRIVIV